jgi:hypothetical protein
MLCKTKSQQRLLPLRFIAPLLLLLCVANLGSAQVLDKQKLLDAQTF